MMELLTSPDAWIALITLTALELVLGIDNIIFISILVDRLPEKSRELGRRLGLFFAMFMRIALLSLLSYLMGITAPLFTIYTNEISGRDLILISGGLFFTLEKHQRNQPPAGRTKAGRPKTTESRFLCCYHSDHPS